MKLHSVKTKICVLLTMLMATLAVLLLMFMLFVTRRVAMETTRQQLVNTLRSNVSYIEVQEQKPSMDANFSYYHNGITTLVYSQNQSLLAGQIPVSYQADLPFENGTLRTVQSGNTEYLVLDLWLASDWDHGVWLRGLAEAPDTTALSKNLLIIAFLALPVFIVLASWGSYQIAKRAFRPLDHITATAEAITDANDLSGRIEVSSKNAEFFRLANDFNQMFERLERSFEAEKQFTSDASHELRTPVSIIKGACEYAKKYDETPEDHAETISMIQRQADKMSSLITQLLHMTRMDQGTENISMEHINFSEFIDTFCKELPIEFHHFTLAVEPEIYLSVNRDFMGRLVRNLIENALKYSSADGHVWVNLLSNKEEVLLSVRDNGIGIPLQEHSKIWQRFYQVDSSRGSDEGCGLGLSMVDQIARIHGGRMTLESTPGCGSTFTLHLPVKNILK